MAYDVKVKIDLMKPIKKENFWIPLILERRKTTDPEIDFHYIYKNSNNNEKNIKSLILAGYTTESTVYKAIELIFEQENAPEKVALCSTKQSVVEFLSDESNVSKNWRQLIVVDEITDGGEDAANYNSTAEIAEKMETLDGKMFFASTPAIDSGDGYLDKYNRTVIFVYDGVIPVPEAALVGEAAGRNPGSFTYKNMKLKGLEPQNLSSTRIEKIHQHGGITFVEKAGDKVTSEGIVASGEYIDIIDSKDYVIEQIQYNVQKLLNSSDKIPYDNNGIAMLESTVVSVLKDAYNNGIIADTDDGKPDYDVSFAVRADTEAEDRAKRKYLNGSFKFALAGAIHTVEIVGEVSI
ncbi:MAG: DUF3383 family protein [Acutalibacteraceae bacterium]